MRDEPSSKLEKSQFDKLIADLGEKLNLTGTEIADILWLAQQNQTTKNQTTIEQTSTTADERNQTKAVNKDQSPQNSTSDTKTTPADTPQKTRQEAKAEVVKSSSSSSTSSLGNTLNIKVPDAPGLRQPLKLVRALRPLIQKIDSETEVILDEEATANRIAKQRIRIPVFQPKKEPAFDLILVVDESNTMIFWRKAIQELQKLFEVQGAFRDVQVWGMRTSQEEKKKGENETGENETGEKEQEIYLVRGTGKTARKHRHYQPRFLLDPSCKRLILVASDCVTDIWHNGKAFEILKIWAQKHPVAIIQMLPQWLWQRTGLSSGAKVQFASLTPRVPNQDLLIKSILLWDDIDFATGTKIPIFTLEEDSARTWSKMIGGRSDAHVTGFVFPPNLEDFIPFTLPEEDSSTPEIEESETTEEITSNFRRTASPMARKLASLLSAAPIITLPIVRIVQAQMLRRSQQVHVAEVFLGGIIKRKQTVIATQGSNPNEITPETNPDDIEFEFINEDVQNNFLDAAPVTDSLEIIEAISKYFATKLGKTLLEFNALLRKPEKVKDENEEDREKIKAFALLSAEVLKRLGGDYVRFAEEMEQNWNKLDTELITLSDISFETVTVNRRGEIINRENKTAQYFTEILESPSPSGEGVDGKGVTLDMVYIPGGKFMMGTADEEVERLLEKFPDDEEYFRWEQPQHEVTVPAFFMGKYPVTQAQWKAVANLPQAEKNLEIDPSEFKGDILPVEQVSWHDAVEFCKRLSNHTGKEYRLPSEAEWEYACRAGTKTPFSFGETITHELANYNASYTFADESQGEYREKSTPVGTFPPNAFCLYDMHGNVYEWCFDEWHKDYEYAPINGESWYGENNKINESNRVLRGGSWYNNPQDCRCAYRYSHAPDGIDDIVGFRVVCGVSPRALQ